MSQERYTAAARIDRVGRTAEQPAERFTKVSVCDKRQDLTSARHAPHCDVLKPRDAQTIAVGSD